MGDWDGSNLKTMGFEAAAGSRRRARSMATRTSAAARSRLVPKGKVTVTREFPSDDVEMTSSAPTAVPTVSSITRVTRFSTSSGPAPG